MAEKKRKEKIEPEFKDYVALVIALLQTTLLPLLVIITFLFVLAFVLLFFLGHRI